MPYYASLRYYLWLSLEQVGTCGGGVVEGRERERKGGVGECERMVEMKKERKIMWERETEKDREKE